MVVRGRTTVHNRSGVHHADQRSHRLGNLLEPYRVHVEWSGPPASRVLEMGQAAAFLLLVQGISRTRYMRRLDTRTMRPQWRFARICSLKTPTESSGGDGRDSWRKTQ